MQKNVKEYIDSEGEKRNVRETITTGVQCRRARNSISLSRYPKTKAKFELRLIQTTTSTFDHHSIGMISLCRLLIHNFDHKRYTFLKGSNEAAE